MDGGFCNIVLDLGQPERVISFLHNILGGAIGWKDIFSVDSFKQMVAVAWKCPLKQVGGLSTREQALMTSQTHCAKTPFGSPLLPCSPFRGHTACRGEILKKKCVCDHGGEEPEAGVVDAEGGLHGDRAVCSPPDKPRLIGAPRNGNQCPDWPEGVEKAGKLPAGEGGHVPYSTWFEGACFCPPETYATGGKTEDEKICSPCPDGKVVRFRWGHQVCQ